MTSGVQTQQVSRNAVGADLGTLRTAAERLRAAGGAAWLNTLRGSAIERANELGLPTKAFEAWRYTNVDPLAETEYRLPGASGAAAPTVEQPELEAAARLVFVDGVLDPAQSDLAVDQVRITPLPADSPPAEAERVIADAVAKARDGLEALAAGLVTTGVVVHVPAGVALERPIHVTFVGRATDEAALLVAPHVVVQAAAQSEVTVIEDHVQPAGATGLTLGTTSLVAGAGAHVRHALLARDSTAWTHYATLRIEQGRDSQVASHRILTGGALVRNNIVVGLRGEQAETLLNGVFVPRERQQHDNYLRVEHSAEHCRSRQYYRGLPADRARGVFAGRIWVDATAQKTDAVQTNANLLLSSRARVYSKPQLEIYADDVKCTHGATTGYLDEDALFYLRARGVPEQRARLLLLHAFAGECLERIEHPGLREWVRGRIDERLAAILETSD